MGYAVLRITTGLCLFGHAIARLSGSNGTNYAAFRSAMAEQFSKTILPSPLTAPVAMIIPPVELVIGFLLIIGLRTREALLAMSALFMIFIFGSCMLQTWAIVSEQMVYVLIAAILLALRSHNALCLDRAP